MRRRSDSNELPRMMVLESINQISLFVDSVISRKFSCGLSDHNGNQRISCPNLKKTGFIHQCQLQSVSDRLKLHESPTQCGHCALRIYVSNYLPTRRTCQGRSF